MKVLIGIATRDRAELLVKAIQSALDQDYPDKQIFVFDDASVDETPQLKAKFPQVQWFRAESPQGYLFARNKMMRETDATFYFSLDDDAWFMQRDEISQGVSLLQQRPDIAAIAYDILSPEQPTSKERTTPYPTCTFIGCGHLLRLSAVEEVGYYTPNPGFYGGEEKDLCLRLLDRNYEVIFLPGVHVWHDKTMQARDLLAQHRSGVCNDLVFAFRRCPSPMLMWLLPAKILSHLRFALTHDLVPSCLAGVTMFLRGIPSLIPTRQPVSQAAVREFWRRSRLYT